ncbi:MAG: hypothetical protein M3460_24945 [Actinomycetota bacterium]|nr:hypothetical protein [Actinomycetota bacterium]
MPSIRVTGATMTDPNRSITPEINTWTRLEALPLSADLGPALQAAIADPLWLLCRQWQFLEFAGEDAGTPIEVRIEGERAQISRYLPGAMGSDAATRARGYSSDGLPLEVTVEREPIRERHPRLAVEAGVHLQRMLNDNQLSDAFITAYPLQLPAGPDDGGDPMGREWLELARGRALDARKLHAALTPLRAADGRLTALPPTPTVPAPSRAKTLEVLQRWLSWYDDLVVDATAFEAWNPRRLEYGFAASALVETIGELVLVADEYTDGTLDWYSVAAAAGSLGRAPQAQGPAALRLRPTLPSPVEYPGKPADRFWEFEDAAVHFGAIDAGPTDLTRMLVVEFALIYGNDWFVVPLRLPVGSLLRVVIFTVRDTFGVVTQITRSRNTDGTPWSLFEVAGGSPAQPGGDYFFLPPTLAQTIEGEPIEQVALCRDEMANMAWGIEQHVQGRSGDPYNRAEEASRRAAQQQLDGPPVDAQLIYRLATAVPEHWIPFVPIPAEGSNPATNPVIQLQRRALLRTETDGQRRAIHPKGILLRTDPRQTPEAEPALRIEEEEVPREGAIVERSFQYARWFDGRPLLWLGRRKHTGRGEGSSGLRFDQLSRP